MFAAAAGLAGAVGVGYVGLKMLYPWVFKDLQYLKIIFPLVKKLMKMCDDGYFLPDVFEEQANKQPDKVFLIFEDKTYTYKFMNEQANRVARAAMKLGIKRGDTVAMVIYNEPAFLWTYLGFLKLGVTLAMINTNQRSKPLLHSLKVANAKYIVVGEGEELADAVAEVIVEFPGTMVYVQGCPKDSLPKGFDSFHDVMKEMPCDNVDREIRRNIKFYDPAVYIYTSGTTVKTITHEVLWMTRCTVARGRGQQCIGSSTAPRGFRPRATVHRVIHSTSWVIVLTVAQKGLPKAAVVSQRRVIQGFVATETNKFRADDVMMISLPLYHSSALLVGVSSVITSGASFVLCRKFSASNFWTICRKNKATTFLYIGELCRYLLATPPNELDQKHSVRLAVGNGLRQDIYREFQQRFAIPWIGELYASTEGPFGMVNCLNVPGSCGRHSPFLNKLLKAEFVQYDIDTEQPARNKEGFCIPAKRSEPGLLLAQINKTQPYDGYKGKSEQSDTKIIRNVLRKGDQYFNTGDVFTRDEEYNLYFNDRLGDTFRWKGENVSTTEVSNILTDLDFITDACVYGVSVPGNDGRAGMAALVLTEGLNSLDENMLSQLSAHCSENVPEYERPVFLRTPKELRMTSTIKQNKVIYKEEAFDKTQIDDDMLVYDKDTKKYKVLTDEIYKDIMDKRYRF